MKRMLFSIFFVLFDINLFGYNFYLRSRKARGCTTTSEQRNKNRQEKLKKLSKDPFNLLALSDDCIKEILFRKIDLYISRKSDSYDSELKIVNFCNLMANTCKRMKDVVNSELFVKQLTEKLLENTKTIELGSRRLSIEIILSACSYSYYRMFLENIVAQLKGNQKVYYWDVLVFHAAHKKDAFLLKYLLSEGAPVDAMYATEVPLYIAARDNNIKVVEFLTDHNASIDKQCTNSEMSPLHIAVLNDHYEIAQCLLEKGASAAIKNWFERTPYKLAKRRGNDRMIKLLESYMEKKELS